MSYANAIKKAQCERVETTIRKRRLLFAGAVQRTHNDGLIRRVMFGTIAGGENPGPGRPEQNWAPCLVDDLGVFRAIEGSTERARWYLVQKRCYGPRRQRRGGSGIREWSKRRDVSRRGGTGTRRRAAGYATQHRTPRVITREWGERKGESRTDTDVDEFRNEIIDRVARYRFD